MHGTRSICGGFPYLPQNPSHWLTYINFEELEMTYVEEGLPGWVDCPNFAANIVRSSLILD
jgi:hypothetical protein